MRRKLEFEELKVGMKVWDEDFQAVGKIVDCKDIHNVFVEYENGGSGLYCLKEGCIEDISIVIDGKRETFQSVQTDVLYAA